MNSFSCAELRRIRLRLLLHLILMLVEFLDYYFLIGGFRTRLIYKINLTPLRNGYKIKDRKFMGWFMVCGNQYRVGELAEKAGVTRRTIHYYTGRGLLPPPEGAGLGTTYSDEHLYRVMLIKKLQNSFLPLDEIKRRLAGMSLAEVKRNLNDDIAYETVAEQQAEYKVKQTRGVVYERLSVGFGVEIHFPQGEMKAAELAEKLYDMAEKLIRE